MGNPFRITYDDFTGGYYVGETDANQPKNTWTGTNVNVTTQDGALVATNSIRQIGLGGSIANATIADDSIWLDAGSGVSDQTTIVDVISSRQQVIILQYQRVTGIPPTYRFRLIGISASDAPEMSKAPSSSPGQSIWGVNASAWFSVTGSSRTPSNLAYDGTYVYVAFGTTLYRFDNSFTSTTAVLPGSTDYTHIGIYKDRMFAFSYTESTFYFSNALDFMTWPTLNFVGVGSPQSPIVAIAPRYDDLLIVKTDSIYSLTGVLSVNAGLRQIYDGIYFQNYSFLNGPRNSGFHSRNNRLFYVDNSTLPYQTNIKFLYGQQNGVIAYYNFGRHIPEFSNNVNLSSSFNDQLMATFPQDSYGQQGFFSLVRFSNGRWTRMSSAPFTFYDPVTANKSEYLFKYLAVNDPTRPFEAFAPQWAQPIFYVQVGVRYWFNGSNYSQRYAVVSLGFTYPEQVSSGTSDYKGWIRNESTANFNNFSTPSTGTVILSPVETEKLSKITAVYVEASLDLDYGQFGDLTGTASMQVTSINQAVDDIPFSSTTYTAVSGTTSTDLSSFGSPYRFTSIVAAPTYTSGGSGVYISEPSSRLNSTRIMRFNPDQAGYGYKHNVSITFSGYKIKRVWVEGESR